MITKKVLRLFEVYLILLAIFIFRAMHISNNLIDYLCHQFYPKLRVTIHQQQRLQQAENTNTFLHMIILFIVIWK